MREQLDESSHAENLARLDLASAELNLQRMRSAAMRNGYQERAFDPTLVRHIAIIRLGTTEMSNLI
jgi:hypothetical protein